MSWSIKLQVPDDAENGSKTIRSQASYQICDDKSCSFPGQWTLNDAKVEVTGGSEPASASVATPSAQPAKPDSNPLIRSKAATLTASVSPNEAKPGETVVFSVKAKVEPGYHIYQYAEAPLEPGPLPTTFDLFDLGGLKVIETWKSTTDAKVKQEPAFDNALVEYFEGEATWNIKLQVPADAAPGSKSLLVQASYQVCDDRSCSPSGRWTLNPVAFQVLAGFGERRGGGGRPLGFKAG